MEKHERRPTRLAPAETFMLDGYRCEIYSLPNRAGGWAGHLNIAPENAGARRRRTARVIVDGDFSTAEEFIQVAKDRGSTLIKKLLTYPT